MHGNSLIVRLRYDGGNLVATLPRQLVRELNWGRRQYVRVFRSAPGALTIVATEAERRDPSDISAPTA